MKPTPGRQQKGPKSPSASASASASEESASSASPLVALVVIVGLGGALARRFGVSVGLGGIRTCRAAGVGAGGHAPAPASEESLCGGEGDERGQPVAKETRPF